MFNNIPSLTVLPEQLLYYMNEVFIARHWKMRTKQIPLKQRALLCRVNDNTCDIKQCCQWEISEAIKLVLTAGNG
jgi:hypothetical protein